MSEIEKRINELTDNEAMRSVLSWITDSGLRIVLVLVAAYIMRHFSGVIIRRVVHSSIRRDSFTTKKDELQREDTIISILSATIRVVIWIAVGVLILDILNVNIGAMLAGAGALGLAIGFGAQSLVSDFVAGLFIIMENQYRVGDIIEINGKSGVVESITMRTTVLRDLDGNQHHVPNGSITNATNMSKEYSNVHFNLGVSYDTDIDAVEKIINKIGADMAKTKTWGEFIINPPAFVRIDSFGDSSVDIKVLARVKPGTQWKVAGEFRRRIKTTFEKNHIEIPYPHLVVKK